MRKSIFIFLGLVLLTACNQTNQKKKVPQYLELLTKKSQVLLEKKGVTFRDLNNNGKLDIYEDGVLDANIQETLIFIAEAYQLNEQYVKSNESLSNILEHFE